MSALVRLEGLSVAYGEQTVVHEVSLEIAPGEIVAVVGESGSGKSTTANAVLGLLPANGRITGGSIEIAGDDVTHASEKELRRLRGRVVGLVPQDPMVGLDPTLRIGAQVAEAVRLRGVDRRSVDAEVLEALRQAGIDDPELRARQYPHELSGGLRQRALIAIALAGKPRLIIADEPTSALDVTVQKRILDHLQSLVREQGIALLIITHDLAVAADRADRVLVMRAGRVLEQGPPAEILVAPREEYTRALIAAAPGLGRGRGRVVPRFEHVAPAPEILRIENVVKEFALPGRRGGGFRASTTCRSRCAPGRRSLWWGSRDRARRRRSGSPSDSSARRAVGSSSREPISPPPARSSGGRSGAASSWCTRIRSQRSIRGSRFSSR
ncbi:Oligopeptide transport ATP-binding protein OppD [Rathayibacter tanaceti]|uniref:Oligopeptide transport ATP-binding protein OppD n=1 Tax=Rathayibacter tanaceti TaxID=1671680 RepID=A0A162GPH2_9MICO|nr:Oligopeptide transport ATP-binding protein OppD [Rathayibacter tanaceti]